MITDKTTIQQVLGSLMQKPQLLSEVDKYSLTIADFPSRFEKYIFSAILGLYSQGASTINPIDIENFLDVNAAAKTTLLSQNGIEYLNDILDLSNVDNFPYYYARLKKINLLRDLQKQGFSIGEYYCEDLAERV